MMNPSGRIVIADNNESDLLTITDLLQRAGYQCTQVWDVLQACRKLEAEVYDLLITEINMPGNEEFKLIHAANPERGKGSQHAGGTDRHICRADEQIIK